VDISLLTIQARQGARSFMHLGFRNSTVSVVIFCHPNFPQITAKQLLGIYATVPKINGVHFSRSVQ